MNNGDRTTIPLHNLQSATILDQLPLSAKEWLESLPWNQRRYVLSLCHLMRAASPSQQAEFLDEYTADGLVSRMLMDIETKEKVQKYLDEFQITTKLDETLIRAYIRQFYIHSAQDSHRQPELYLESALRLIMQSKERTNVFNYMLGFEIFKIIFRMSWDQQERMYRLQKNQEEFIEYYIKPIRHAHIVNRLVVPKDKNLFFAERDYYVQPPEISDKKLISLIMATFTTDIVVYLGFSVIRHIKYIRFDYDYIFTPEREERF